MTLLFSLVPVAEIVCNDPNKINPNLLQRAAKSIVSGHGIINPIILKATGIDSYELVDGIFEYYAAVEAEKLDPMRCELINAYIIPQSQDRQFIAEQVELFRHQSTQPNNNHGTLSVMNSIDAFVKAVMQQIMPELKKITESLAVVEAALVKPDLSPIAELEAVAPAVLKETLETVTAPEPIVSPISELPVAPPLSFDPFIEFLNTASLGELTILKSGLQKVRIEHIINERKSGEYQSKQDFLTRLETRGIKEQSYATLLNKWQAKQPATTSTSDETPIVTALQLNATATVLETVQPEPIISKVSNLSAAATPANPINDVVNATTSKLTTPTQQQIILEDNEYISETTTKPATAPLSGIDKFNSMGRQELMSTLKHLGIPTEKIQIIVDQRPFGSFNDLAEIKGMGKKRVNSIIEKFA